MGDTHELKPCPFCDGAPRIVEPHQSDRSIEGETDDEEWLSFIECDCVDMFFVKGSATSQDEARQSVVTAWNRRPALSAGQAQPGSIKPLKWEASPEWKPGEFVTEWYVYSVAGRYHVWCDPTVAPDCWHTEYPGKTYEGTEHATVSAAKAAAQSDYEARIRSALAPPAVPGEVERENAKLVELIKTRFLGVHPDELDCYLEYDDWTRILSALSVPEGGDKGDGWRPIDTAPIGAKGTSWMMLAYGPEGDQSVSVGMKFHDKYYAASTFYVGGPHDSRQFRFQEHEVFPTHWKHLPAAPSASIEGDTQP